MGFFQRIKELTNLKKEIEGKNQEIQIANLKIDLAEKKERGNRSWDK